MKRSWDETPAPAKTAKTTTAAEPIESTESTNQRAPPRCSNCWQISHEQTKCMDLNHFSFNIMPALSGKLSVALLVGGGGVSAQLGGELR